MPLKHRLLSRVSAAVLTALLGACAPQVAHWHDIRAKPQLAAGQFLTADDVTLPVIKWLPEGPPRAVLVGVHGFDDYSRAFAYMAPFLAKRGIAVYAYDQRGFGAAPHRGLWPGTDKLVRDLRLFTKLIKGRYPGTPVYWLGHSMGAAVVILAAARSPRPPVKGLILAAPAVWGEDTLNPFYRFVLWTGAHTLPWLNVSAGHLNIQVSDNIEVLKKLSRDPLMIHTSRLDTLYGLVGLMDRALAASDRVKLPVLVQYGLRDQVIPRRSVCSMIARMPDHPTVAFYPRGYHLLMRDLHAEQVWEDESAWLRGRPVASAGGTVAGVCGKPEPGPAAARTGP